MSHISGGLLFRWYRCSTFVTCQIIFPPRVMFICQNSVVSKLPNKIRFGQTRLFGCQRSNDNKNAQNFVFFFFLWFLSLSAVEEIWALDDKHWKWALRILKNDPVNQSCISGRFDSVVRWKHLHYFCLAVTGSDALALETSHRGESERSLSHTNQTESWIRLYRWSLVHEQRHHVNSRISVVPLKTDHGFHACTWKPP